MSTIRISVSLLCVCPWAANSLAFSHPTTTADTLLALATDFKDINTNLSFLSTFIISIYSNITKLHVSW